MHYIVDCSTIYIVYSVIGYIVSVIRCDGFPMAGYSVSILEIFAINIFISVHFTLYILF